MEDIRTFPNFQNIAESTFQLEVHLRKILSCISIQYNFGTQEEIISLAILKKIIILII